MPFSVSAPGAGPGDHGLRLAAPPDEYSARYVWKRVLFHSIEGVWTAMLSMMRRVPEGESNPEKRENYSTRLRSLPAER